jgi:hypothetical protein
LAIWIINPPLPSQSTNPAALASNIAQAEHKQTPIAFHAVARKQMRVGFKARRTVYWYCALSGATD